MRTFPGSEYGPDAAPPSPARIQQISQEQCEAAVRRYLGAKFDPNSQFTVSMLWSGDEAWRQSGERRMLCGLQLPGPNNQQLAFKGKVADIDQSKVWPAGTCLGIDPATNQPIDIPVDCAAPHAMEVTGAVNLAEKFPNALPAEPEQDGFIKDACTRMTDAYLAPIKLRTTTLTLIYTTMSLPSWSAGSRRGGVQHRRDPGQRRLGGAAQQRQGAAADQRSAAGAAAGHPRGAAHAAADTRFRQPTPAASQLQRQRRRPHIRRAISICPRTAPAVDSRRKRPRRRRPRHRRPTGPRRLRPRPTVARRQPSPPPPPPAPEAPPPAGARRARRRG